MSTPKDRRKPPTAQQTYCTESTTAQHMARSISAIIQASSPTGDFRRACLHILRRWHAEQQQQDEEAAASANRKPAQRRRHADRPDQPDEANNRRHINAAIRLQCLRLLYANLIGQ